MEQSSEMNARRERDFQDQIRAHGGTGFPPDIDPLEACHKGMCMKCSGRWGPLHLHVHVHYPGLSMADGIRAYREEFRISDGVPLASDQHRETLRQAQLARIGGPNGKQIRAHLAQKASGPHPEKYGKTGIKPSGKERRGRRAERNLELLDLALSRGLLIVRKDKQITFPNAGTPATDDFPFPATGTSGNAKYEN